MPDNHSESKFMAMLERKGIVHRNGQVSDTSEAEYREDSSNEDVQTGLGFDSVTGEFQKVTPAARQPVPGISSAAISENSHRMQEGAPQQSVVNQRFPAYQSEPDSSGDEAPYPGMQHNENQSGERGAPVRFDESHSGASHTSDLTDRYLEIDELFDALSLRAKRTDTIYLVEEYMKTLPQSLPDEAKREIVGRIITASGFDYDLLMGDGVLRVKMLKEYAEKFAQRTDNYVTLCQNELSELDQKAIRIRSMIDERREMHKKQFLTIEAEAQRLKDILTFLSG